MHGFWGLLSATFNEWMEDKAPRLGACLLHGILDCPISHSLSGYRRFGCQR